MNATNTHPHESGAARVLRAVPDEPGQFGDGWEQPVPLTAAQRTLPPFPVHVLPGWMADMVSAVTEFTQTPPDLAGCVALSALSTAAGGRITTCIRPGWTQPVNLFVIVALPPGSRKSDVFAAMAGPIRAAQAELVDLALPRIEEARVQKAVAEREAEKLEKKASTADAVSIGMAGDAALRAQEIVIPTKPRLVVDDVTAEIAATIMSQQGGRLAVLAPEGGIVANIAGRYSGTPNYEVFLRGHAGEYLEVDRQGRESDFIEHAYLTLGLVVQPQIVRDLGQIKAAKERGLLGRFLYSLPVSTVGHREIRVPEVPEQVAADYRARIGGLTLQLATWSAPEIVDFSAGADEAMFELQTEIEPRLGPGGAWHHIADWAGKYAGTVARLAGLLHLADRPADAWHHEISVSTFARARELGSYFLAHALGAFDHMGKDESYDDARALLTWIAGDRVPQFTRRDAHRANRKRFVSASEVGSALELLEEHGHIRQLPLPERQGVGRKPSPTYLAHPIHLSAGLGQFGQNGQNHE